MASGKKQTAIQKKIQNNKNLKFDGRGRKSLLSDPVKVQGICDMILKGHTLYSAMRLCQIDQSCLYYYKEKARQDFDAGKDSIYTQFFLKVESAQAEFEMDLIKRINEHSKKSWQAGAWLLERHNPKEWGARRIENEISERKLRLEQEKFELEKKKIDLLEKVDKELAIEIIRADNQPKLEEIYVVEKKRTSVEDNENTEAS